MKNRKIDNSSQLQYLFKQLSALQPSKFFPSSPDKREYLRTKTNAVCSPLSSQETRGFKRTSSLSTIIPYLFAAA
jgi:hypothetical protein